MDGSKVNTRVARGRVVAAAHVILVALAASGIGREAQAQAQGTERPPTSTEASAPPGGSAALAAGAGTTRYGGDEPVPGQGAVLSEADALERLRRESLQLLAARHRVSQARADVVAAGVWPNPTLLVNALPITQGALSGGRNELTVGVAQEIPLAGQVGLRKSVARELLTAEEKAYASTVFHAVFDLRTVYVDLASAQERYRVLRGGIADLSRGEAIVAERAARGATPAYDRYRVSVERGQAESRLADAEVDLASARAALATLIGQSVSTGTLTAAPLPDELPDPPGALEPLVRRALASRPDLDAARAFASAAETNIALVRRSYVPSPSLSATYGRLWAVPEAGDGHQLYLGVGLPLPVFDRGQGRKDRAVAEAAEARVQSDAFALQVRREVERTFAVLRVRVEAYRKFREATAKDADRLRATAELAYREGRTNIVELLDAYRTYLETQERLIELRADALRARLDLERALGPSS
jgi:cobalt-zinc-cadmium efflux system outer membrane protein